MGFFNHSWLIFPNIGAGAKGFGIACTARGIVAARSEEDRRTDRTVWHDACGLMFDGQNLLAPRNSCFGLDLLI